MMAQAGCSFGHQFMVDMDQPFPESPGCRQDYERQKNQFARLAPMIKEAVMAALREHDAAKNGAASGQAPPAEPKND